MSVIKPITEYDRQRGRRASTERRPVGDRGQAGRYDGRSNNTRMPGEGLARMPLKSRQRNDTNIAAVEDPWGDGKQRVFVTVNRRVDILEMERSHKRISEAAYRTGRLVQAVCERLGRVVGSNWANESRVDTTLAKELNIIRTIDTTVRIQQLFDGICRQIGMRDARILRRLLGDRMSFSDCAAFEGKSGERGEGYVAARFRDALEELSDAWSAKGKAASTPNDKHKAAASGVDVRQATAIAGGATRERLVGEAEAARATAQSAPTLRGRVRAARDANELSVRVERLQRLRAGGNAETGLEQNPVSRKDVES